MTELVPDAQRLPAAAPPRGLRHVHRSDRLCRAEREGAQLPRRARRARAGLSLSPSCAPTRSRWPAGWSPRASPRATASRWSPRPGPSSPRCSAARSMPAPGRCRCRCRPPSAARTTTSSSSAVQLESADPKLLLYPAEIAEMAGAAAARQGCEGIDWESFAAREAPEVALPEAAARRHLLPAVFARLDPLPDRRRGHPPRAAAQPLRPRRRR